MMRRNWIKLFVDQSLRGTMMIELKPAERWVWIGFLLLCGDSPFDGQISVTETMGYTDEQLAALLQCNAETITSAKSAMVEHNKISVDMFGVIKILKWNRYQSEYARQKRYRTGKSGDSTTKGDTDVLHDEVTTDGDTLDREREKEKE